LFVERTARTVFLAIPLQLPRSKSQHCDSKWPSVRVRFITIYLWFRLFARL